MKISIFEYVASNNTEETLNFLRTIGYNGEGKSEESIAKALDYYVNKQATSKDPYKALSMLHPDKRLIETYHAIELEKDNFDSDSEEKASFTKTTRSKTEPVKEDEVEVGVGVGVGKKGFWDSKRNQNVLIGIGATLAVVLLIKQLQ
jgi:hypothetical protein